MTRALGWIATGWIAAGLLALPSWLSGSAETAQAVWAFGGIFLAVVFLAALLVAGDREGMRRP